VYIRCTAGFLSCVFLLTNLLAAQQIRSISENNVTIRFHDESVVREAQAVLDFVVAHRRDLSQKFPIARRTQIEIIIPASTSEFCQLTAAPWWQSSIYRDGAIYLQPVRILRERGILETTLRHELVHRLIDVTTHGNCPRWLTEALAIYHSGEIAHLRPVRQQQDGDCLKWACLDERLESTNTREDLERLYYQLYRLARYLMESYGEAQIRTLLARLGEKQTLAAACREAILASPAEIERRWLQGENAR